MKMKKNSGDNTPTANLAINKSRIKKYGKNKSIPSYYLEKGQEFQLELFNPTQGKILTTIKLNGKAISGSLILRPGERVFLDRYLQSSKRFLFDTYKVNKSKKTKKAIEPNGDIEIAFFKENEYNPYLVNTTNYVSSNSFDTTKLNSLNYTNTTTSPDFNLDVSGYTNFSDDLTLNVSSNIGLGTTNPANTLEITGNCHIKSIPNKEKKSKEIETGRVEEGSDSDQNLVAGSGDFEMISFHVVKYKLLPKSEEKLSTVQYFSKYCGNCGAKCKTPYCSHCGTKQ